MVGKPHLGAARDSLATAGPRAMLIQRPVLKTVCEGFWRLGQAGDLNQQPESIQSEQRANESNCPPKKR